MKGSRERMKVLVLRAGLALAVALAAVAVARPAEAQAFPSPYDDDPYADEPPGPMIETPPMVHPGALRGYVARILARHGCRLVGPLRDRGGEILASGVDARGRRVNFLIDPSEDDVVRAWPSAPDFGRRPYAPMGEGGPGDFRQTPPRAYRPPRRTDVGRDDAGIPRRAAVPRIAGRPVTPLPYPGGISAGLVVPRPPPPATKVPGVAAAAPAQAPQARMNATVTPEARSASGPAPSPMPPKPASAASERAEAASPPKPPSQPSLPAGIENETAPKSNMGE